MNFRCLFGHTWFSRPVDDIGAIIGQRIQRPGRACHRCGTIQWKPTLLHDWTPVALTYLADHENDVRRRLAAQSKKAPEPRREPSATGQSQDDINRRTSAFLITLLHDLVRQGLVRPDHFERSLAANLAAVDRWEQEAKDRAAIARAVPEALLVLGDSLPSSAPEKLQAAPPDIGDITS